ncbi:chemotaxis protein CheW [Pseudobacillus wudalianchiensis]|uniref:Chemotaxis protein CheA n=1 Tax=Pseudobacillus wudalianchiensis TaxID=1743143 RepID=A0A1B9AMP0_9BACI|nr:chemotaxis protein CheW [Bacillus wudalianchiensis]OCA85120.1 histidine kinase [Bacillus wudalianchiensis]
MDMDMSLYLGAFLDEVDEQIQVLEEEVLNLEQDGENLDTIQRIFRSAHTLKGSSAAMGFDKMKELTHKVENVFDLIRNQQLKVNTEIINLIFESIDAIKQLKEAILNGTLEEADVSDLTGRLEQVKTNADESETKSKPAQETAKSSSEDVIYPDVKFDQYQEEIVKKAFDMNMNVVAVYVSINEKAMLKSVRAFLIHNNLKEIGEIVASYPEAEVIENEEAFTGNLVYLVVTESKNQDVFKAIQGISDIQAIHLTDVTKDNLNSFLEGKKLEVTGRKKMEETNQTPVRAEAKVKVQQTVRVDVDRLENLLNLVGELVIGQTRLADIKSRFESRYPNDADVENFQEATNNLRQIVSELQEGMMKTRMLPIEQLFNRFPRMVRDISQKANKDIEFILEGKETELDRNLIEEIADPIIHLLRNSLDHGIESPEEREQIGKPRKGTVRLKAAHEENHIVISISDDGRGIDAEKIKQSAVKKNMITEEEAERISPKDAVFLIFKSGVSTAKAITDISGRGVGMDIVRSHIEKLNGMIDIETEVGQGTTFIIKLPLTLAIIRSLLVQMGEKQFAVPLANVQEIIRLDKDEIQTIQNKEVGVVRGRVLPLIRLHRRLKASEDTLLQKKRLFVVVIGLAEKRVGIVIDKPLGNREIVIKPLGQYIGMPKYIAGATIMGDGSVALILDAGAIVYEEGTAEPSGHGAIEKMVKKQSEQTIQLATFKLGNEEYGLPVDQVKDIITVPELTPAMNSPFSIIGMMNLRGNIMPVMDLRRRLHLAEGKLTRKSRVIVTETAETPIGLLVDQVVQVMKVNKETTEKAATHENKPDDRYIQSVCNLGERLVILLHLSSLFNIEELTESALLQQVKEK